MNPYGSKEQPFLAISDSGFLTDSSEAAIKLNPLSDFALVGIMPLKDCGHLVI
jgi:hypothetical protein